MLDNRNIMPSGSAMLCDKEQHPVAIMLFRIDPETGGKRLFMASPVKQKGKGKNNGGGNGSGGNGPGTEKKELGSWCLDVMHIEPPEDFTRSLATNLEDQLEINMIQNLPKVTEQTIFTHDKYPPSDSAVIVGAGKVDREDLDLLESIRDRTTVITVGKAQRDYIRGDYYVGLDPWALHMRSLTGEDGSLIDISNTIGVLSLNILPEIIDLPWKSVILFGSRWGHGKGLPMYHPGGNVTMAAMQFAAKTLCAKSIFLLGVEQPVLIGRKSDGKRYMNLDYYDHKQTLEACAWWISRTGIKIYNCTENTTMHNGVILGALQESLEAAKII